jgi:hypothetical protein
MRYRVSARALLWLLAVAAFATAGEPADSACAVAGFVNAVDHKEWQDARVGMGVRAMLAQAVSATGLFALVEEKPEIKAKLEQIARNAWTGKDGTKLLESASVELRQGGARFMASGKVCYFGRPRTRASVGPLHFASEEVEITLEVTLTDMVKGKKMTALGKGKAVTTASSGIFTFHGENLDADASMVGTATRKAVDAAVAEIAKKYRKVYLKAH